MRIAILGGGHGCYAAAADLSEQGHEVRLWRRDAAALQSVIDAGSIVLKDAAGSRAVPIALATADMAQALQGAQLIVLPSPATAQLDMARLSAETEGNGLARHLAVLPASELNARHYRAYARELAQQVYDNVRKYSQYLDVRSAVFYGGVSIRPQYDDAERGLHLLVATPGRLIDHLHQKTVDLSALEVLVLDEADRMLDMGFIVDIKRIMAKLPEKRQTLLFSATYSNEIKQLADELLNKPQLIEVAATNAAADRVEQQAYLVDRHRKRELLSHVIGKNNWPQVLVFVRTKHGADRLAKQLAKDGLKCAAIHGDKSQGARTKALDDFKSGAVRVLVATDIAARGLDISELPYVVNYDLPQVPEDYVHRIGRTGRAGRDGKAILFVSPRERRLLRTIEHATRQPIEKMSLPTGEVIEQRRIESFRASLANTIEAKNLSFFQDLINDWREKLETTDADLAAALLFMAQKDQPLNVASQFPEIREPHARGGERDDRPRRERSDRPERSAERPDRGPRVKREMKGDYQTYRIEVGKEHGVRAGDIVGAIANEANIDSQFIGNIKLFDHFSTVELPAAIPNEIFQHLKKVYVRKQKLNITVDSGAAPAGDRRPSNGPGPRPGAAPRAPRKPRD